MELGNTMRTLWTIDPTPTPMPAYEGDPNLVTPGVVGFAVTFLIAVVTVLLVIDMTRRIRRVRYREEVREQLVAEQELAANDGNKRTPPSNGS